MKKIGINELYQMILEEIDVNELNNRQRKKRLKKNPKAASTDAKAKVQSDINQIKNILNSLDKKDEKTKKDVVSVLNNVETLNESDAEPATDEGKKVTAILKGLLGNDDTKAVTIAQVRELLKSLTNQTTDEETPQVNLNTDGSEEDFLQSIEQGFEDQRVTLIVNQRLNKKITVVEFIGAVAKAVKEKLNIEQDDFIIAYKKVYAKDLVEKLDKESTPEGFVEKIVEAVKDFGLTIQEDSKPSVVGPKLLDMNIRDLAQSGELFSKLFPLSLFVGYNKRDLATKFIGLRNMKSSSERLDTTALGRSGDQFIKRLGRFEDKSSVKDMDSLENLKIRVQEFAETIKTYILGDFKGNKFKTEIMETLGGNDFWSLNKKGEEVPDDFFIEFDESLRNIAKLEAWEDEDVKKVSGSIEKLGLDLGPEKTSIINRIDNITSSISSAAKKLMYDRGIQKIRDNMEELVSDQNLTGYSKRKAQESSERLLTRFKERFEKKYGYSADEVEVDSDESDEDKPISDAEAENEQEKKVADDANRYSQEEYNKWLEKNTSASMEDINQASQKVLGVLSDLLEATNMAYDEEPDEDGIDPEQINEDDASKISDDIDSIDEMKKLGAHDYFTQRVLRSVINSKLYKKIVQDENLKFESIKADFRKAVKPIVKRALTMEIMDIESEMEEQMISEQAGLRKKLAFNAKKFLGMEPGDFKSFYVHKYLENQLVDITNQISNYAYSYGIASWYKFPDSSDKKGSDIPPHPEVKIKTILEKFGKMLMELDSMTLKQAQEKINSESGEESLGEELSIATFSLASATVGLALLKSYKYLFSNQKFSFSRFLKALGRGKSRSKLYSGVLKKMKLNSKERENLAWYFSKKGNVKKFAKKYLKEHSEYKEIVNQDESRVSNAIFNITRAFTGRRFGAKSKKPDATSDAEETESEETTETPSVTLEEALKPIVKTIIKEELDSLIMENVNLKQLTYYFKSSFNKIKRENQERAKAYINLIKILKYANNSISQNNVDQLENVIDEGFKKLPRMQSISGQSQEIIKDFTKFIFKSYRGNPPVDLLKSFIDYGNGLIRTKSSFFIKSSNTKGGGAQKKSPNDEQGTAAQKKTADTDKLLNVIDKVNDDWDAISNSTKDGKLKTAMDYIEKIALAEIKKIYKNT